MAIHNGPLLIEKGNDFAKQMNLNFTTNLGSLVRFKKQNSIIFKNICDESRGVSQEIKKKIK